MNDPAIFKVEFRAEAPDAIKVGDQIMVAGRATVSAIKGELVDITSWGDPPTVVLGELTFSLFSNTMDVEPIA